MDEESYPRVPAEDRGRHAADPVPAAGPATPGPAAPEAGPARVGESWDDWREAQGTAGAHPGSVVGWAGLMAVLVAGLALMGAAFTDGNGAVFAAGLGLATLAFVIPLEILGRRER